MKLLAAFGDKRYAYMARMAQDAGIDAWTFGMDGHGVEGVPELPASRLQTVDAVVMPGLFSKGQGCDAAALLEALTPGITLYLFSALGASEALRARFQVVDLSSDEQYAMDNAEFTAEGALSMAMRRAEFSLMEACCLVVGFGRVGLALTDLLVGIGANVTVAARREEVRKRAMERGAQSVDFTRMLDILPQQQLVFSTPAQRVLERVHLRLIKPATLLLDLSSPPYGVDVEAALDLGIQAWREPGLPGRYCPQSAGRALLRAVRNATDGGESS